MTSSVNAEFEIIRENPESAAPRYATRAAVFVREGLSVTVDRIHGPMTPAHRLLAEEMIHHGLGPEDLEELFRSRRLEPPVAAAIEQIGGPGRLNRHVSGQDLCWGLRDFALECWGLLAPAVLRHWGVTETLDFGHIVYDAIAKGHLQKQPADSIDDFRAVFDFPRAFEEGFRVKVRP